VQVHFITPDKRSFLLLVNKLSTTSSANNISLLNEFFFYLIKNIKEQKTAEIDQLRQTYSDLFSSLETIDDDTIIGYHLYQWIKKDTENILIDDEIIMTTIRENTLCDSAIQDTECFYKFREKYRDLPYLAYTIGILKEPNKIQLFENFLKDLSPIITVTHFSFEKVTNREVFSDMNQFYQGTLSFNAYGRSMTSEEVNEISTTLGKLCFGQKEGETIPLSVDRALERVDQSILQLGSSLQLSNVINDLEELQLLFTAIQEEYGELSNYQKTIKLFETFRMLKDATLCSV
jgi:hypothetical protein